MKVNINNISVKNFLSIGQKWLKIDFRKGLFRVTGENLDTDSRNGVGKSSIFIDAIMFGLFGKPVRKISLADIPNTINNGRGCEVKISFSVGATEYTIHRGIKPSFLKLLKDGEEVEQDSAKKFTQKKIDDIICSDFNTFSHLLIMSNSYSTPFLDLDSTKKRGILEDILGVSIFGKMNDILKKDNVSLNSDYKIAGKEYEYSNSSLVSLKDSIKELLGKSKSFKKNKKERINELTETITLVEEKIEKCKQAVMEGTDLEETISNNNEVLAKLKDEVLELSVNNQVLTKEIKSRKKILKELDDKPICPVCNTETNTDHIKKHINELKETIKVDKLKIDENEKKDSELEKDIDEIDSALTELDTKVRLAEKNDVKLSGLNDKIQDLNDRLVKVEDEKNNFDELIDKDDLKNKTNEVKRIKANLLELTKKRDYAEYIKKLLSDNGIKNYIIKKILTFWNKKVNFYLKELNSDFSILFDENLDAVIKSRNRDPLQYHSFSGGEKARIDVAILCSVLDLSKLQNSVDLNLMVIDELLDSALDAGGREDVLRLLRQKSLEEDASIYVISHATDLPTELFDKEITLYKKNGFTYI
jgi:DNA repair exonuclease SbcCD ATPase subunit